MSEYVVLFRLPSGSLYASYDEEIVVRFEKRTEQGRLSKTYRANELPLDSAVATMVVAYLPAKNLQRVRVAPRNLRASATSVTATAAEQLPFAPLHR